MLERPDTVVIDAILEQEERLRVGRRFPDPQDFELLAAEIRWLRENYSPRGHVMTQADKDARTVMYKELRERPAEGVKDASDKMDMRKMEGIEIRRVRPGPAINAVFSHEPATSLLLRTETDNGFPIGSSEWVERPNGEWVLRITDLPVPPVPETQAINIVLDGPSGVPGVPGRGRLVDIETDNGESICPGDWHPRPDGKWFLRITELPVVEPKKPCEINEEFYRRLEGGGVNESL